MNFFQEKKENFDVIENIYASTDDQGDIKNVLSARHSSHNQFQKQRRFMALVIFLSLILVIFSGIRLFARIQSPIKELAKNSPTSAIFTALNTPKTSLFENVSPFQDTDQDGLTDEDEKNLYSTSPYLEDTDSDGALDSEEITKGTDPTCLLGTSCARLTLPNNSHDNTQETQAISENSHVTPEYLRNLLGKSNVDKAVYENLNDKELLDFFYATLNEQKDQDITQEGAPDIRAMSISQIRELLKQNNMPQETVNALSDDDIRQALEETLKNQ